jgi:hypothetical protein
MSLKVLQINDIGLYGAIFDRFRKWIFLGPRVRHCAVAI